MSKVIIRDKIIFTPTERNSHVGKKFLRFFENELERLREKNDTVMEEANTQAIRGKISQLKDSIKMLTGRL